jgi:hypothetical protein
MSIDLCSIIDLHHVVLSEHGIITGIASEMSCTLVDTATGWEGNTSFKTTCFDQSPIGLFDLVANVPKLHAWSHHFLSHFSYLSVALSCFTEIVNLRSIESVSITEFSISSSLQIEVTGMIHELTFWEHVVWELLAYWD